MQALVEHLKMWIVMLAEIYFVYMYVLFVILLILYQLPFVLIQNLSLLS